MISVLTVSAGGGLIGFAQAEIGNRQLQDEGIEMQRTDFDFAAQLFLNLFDADFLDKMRWRHTVGESQYEQENGDDGDPEAEFTQLWVLREAVVNMGMDRHDSRAYHFLLLMFYIRQPEV